MNKVLLESLDQDWNAGAAPPSGIVLENMRRRGFDHLRLWLYGRSHSTRSLVGCFLAMAMAGLAGFILHGWLVAVGLGAAFLLLSLKLDRIKRRMSSVVVVLADRLSVSDARRGRKTGHETILPFSGIEHIEIESRPGFRASRHALRIVGPHGTYRIGHGLPMDALRWLRQYLIMEVTGLTWKPIFNVGRRSMRNVGPSSGGPDGSPPIVAGITPKLARLYLQEAAGKIASLAREVDRKDTIAIKRETHWLKSSSANVGARRLSELCQLLEARALNNDLADVEAMHAEIQREYLRVTAALEAILSEASDTIKQRPNAMPRFDVGQAAKIDGARPRQFDAKILIVEDSMVNREIAAEYLSTCGCAVEMAETGEQAITAYMAEDFDLILMDCQMPVLDGYQAARGIREREAKLDRKPVPIVALTANTSYEDKQRCFTAGMNDYVSKPYPEERIREVLARWLPHKEKRDGVTGRATHAA